MKLKQKIGIGLTALGIIHLLPGFSMMWNGALKAMTYTDGQNANAFLLFLFGVVGVAIGICFTAGEL